ncbi:hypothetical protein [Anaerostipes hadrus]|jgi:hypothetical protein|uniref:hypothetical protein n=1 Tax=Anaerostipes hadrus TaxID=649756 RepID=UPI0036F3B27A
MTLMVWEFQTVMVFFLIWQQILRISEVEKSLILKGFRGLSSDIKSEAIWDIVRLMRLKVITYDDLSEFSGELQQEVKRMIEICKK